MEDKPKIRMSQLNAIAACPASWREEKKHWLNVSSEASRAGTMEHEIAAALVKGEKPNADALMARYGVDKDELEKVFDRLAFLEEKPHWEAHVEEEVAYGDMIGHVDLYLISPDGKEAEVIDWKSGQKETEPIEHNYQIMGYVMGVFTNHPSVEKVTARIIYTRLGFEESVTWTKAQILGEYGVDDTVFMAAKAALKDNPEYRPGCSHCQYCAARADCPALNAKVPALLSGGEVAKRFNSLSRDEMISAIHTAKAYAKLCDEVIEAAKNRVDALGPIDMGNGRMFAKIEEQQDVIEPTPEAWAICDELCGEHFPEAVKISKGALVKAAVANYEAETDDAPRGYKSQVERLLMGKLRGAGAIQKKTIFKYQIINREIEDNGKRSDAA